MLVRLPSNLVQYFHGCAELSPPALQHPGAIGEVVPQIELPIRDGDAKNASGLHHPSTFAEEMCAFLRSEMLEEMFRKNPKEALTRKRQRLRRIAQHVGASAETINVQPIRRIYPLSAATDIKKARLRLSVQRVPSRGATQKELCICLDKVERLLSKDSS
ncbi:MAG TPA: hypothetical protein VH458_10520 [Vicinamibacterales bacterium]